MRLKGGGGGVLMESFAKKCSIEIKIQAFYKIKYLYAWSKVQRSIYSIMVLQISLFAFIFLY